MPYFLKLDGIDGESHDDRHRGEIDVLSFSWGVASSGSAIRGGGAGKAVFQDLHFGVPLSKASPKLMLACATGQHVPSGTLTVRKAGGDEPVAYYTIKMTDCIVSSYQQQGSRDDADGRPMDEFSLAFARIEVEYAEQQPDGTLGAPVKAGYDIKANKPV